MSLIDEQSLDSAFLSVPGGDLVDKLIMQMQAVPQLRRLFGAPGLPSSSWANYNRMDWPVRQLPAMNVFESQAVSRSSDNGYLTGTLQLQVYWPSEFRRDDISRIPAFFHGVMENFFSSKYVTDMLDEIYFIQRPMKVYGLNELGKMMNWVPNVEGLTDTDLTPMTILNVEYRIDLRAWDRALEYEGRTVENPFETTLSELTEVLGEIEGVDDTDAVRITIPIDLTLNEG